MVKVALLSSIEMPEPQEEEKKNEELLEASRLCYVATAHRATYISSGQEL